MSARRVQWKCPNGLHPGILGPQKPRRDNIVRYCLPCSEQTGRLVERVSPALEKRRAERSERQEVKRSRAREREAAYYTVAGVNLFEEMKVMARLPVFRRLRKEHYWRAEMPTLRVSHTPNSMPSRFGTGGNGEVMIKDYPGATSLDVKVTLLHELVHEFLGQDRSDKRNWHGRKFKAHFREAIEEYFGVRVQTPNVYHGTIERKLIEKGVRA